MFTIKTELVYNTFGSNPGCWPFMAHGNQDIMVVSPSVWASASIHTKLAELQGASNVLV